MSARLLGIVRERPGITLDDLAVELYGDEGRTRVGRARARALVRRLEEEGRLRSDSGKYQPVGEL